MIDIAEHLGLANYVVTQLYRYDFLRERYEFEDLLQLGYLGLVRAAKTFNEDKKIKFSTWACPKMKYYNMQIEIETLIQSKANRIVIRFIR